MRKHRAEANRQDRAEQPDNLLDLNRALPGYAYHPAPQGYEPMRTPPPQPRKRWKKMLLWIAGLAVAAGLLTGGWVVWKLLANQVKIFGWGGILSLVQDTKLKGEDEGHVNILLAGNSADVAGHNGAQLTDSIMVVSINAKANTAFMLSVPRDLYVDIPGQGYAKINEAYQDGERSGFQEAGYPEGGMGLLAKTVSERFGMPIHYYALVNYSAVREAVDAVGGITVTITSTDPRGLYDPSPDYSNSGKPLVKLPNGPNTLRGVQALGLTRARGGSYGSYGYALSDFERTKNQRLVLLALKDKATSPGTLSNPVKLGELFDSVGNNVQTNLSLGEARRLYDITKAIPDNSVTSVGLNDVNGRNLLTSYQTRSGQSALVPRAGVDDYSAIQAYIDSLLNPPPPPATPPE